MHKKHVVQVKVRYFGSLFLLFGFYLILFGKTVKTFSFTINMVSYLHLTVIAFSGESLLNLDVFFCESEKSLFLENDRVALVGFFVEYSTANLHRWGCKKKKRRGI